MELIHFNVNLPVLKMIFFVAGLPHGLHLQTAIDQGGADEAEERRRAPALGVLSGLSARGGEFVQGRVSKTFLLKVKRFY